MFNIERKANRLNESISINLGKNTFKDTLLEAGLDHLKLDSVITTALQESNQVYDGHVQNSLREYSIESLNKAMGILETTIDIISAFKNIVAGEMAQFKAINKRVIETYEPLLKRLDRHKYGYQIPEYNLENLEAIDILTRVLNLLSKKFNFNLYGPGAINCDEVESAITRFKRNYNEYHEDLKRAILGVPNSASIDDFPGIVRSFLVSDNNLQMKRIGDDIFNDLRSAEIGIDSLDNVIGLLQKEIFGILEHKAVVENGTGNDYVNSVYTNAIIIRTNLIASSLTYIEDIIKIKIHIAEEMCINHRKVIIDGYEKISKDPESNEGIYLPNNDPEIVKTHSEYLSGHWIGASK